MRNHPDDMHVSPARLGCADCDAHGSLHICLAIHCHEDELPLEHDFAESFMGPLTLGGALPFGATCTPGRARDHEQGSVVLAKDADGCRSEQPEASTAALLNPRAFDSFAK
jgi:hypothetical protein